MNVTQRRIPLVGIVLTLISTALVGCHQSQPTRSPDAVTFKQVQENPNIPQSVKEGMQQQQQTLQNNSQALAAEAKAYQSQSKQ